MSARCSYRHTTHAVISTPLSCNPVTSIVHVRPKSRKHVNIIRSNRRVSKHDMCTSKHGDCIMYDLISLLYCVYHDVVLIMRIAHITYISSDRSPVFMLHMYIHVIFSSPVALFVSFLINLAVVCVFAAGFFNIHCATDFDTPMALVDGSVRRHGMRCNVMGCDRMGHEICTMCRIVGNITFCAC